MDIYPRSLRGAVEQDMARLDLTQRDIGNRLGVSQQSVAKWLEAGRVPRERVPALLEVLGPESATADWLKREAERNTQELEAQVDKLLRDFHGAAVMGHLTEPRTAQSVRDGISVYEVPSPPSDFELGSLRESDSPPMPRLETIGVGSLIAPAYRKNFCHPDDFPAYLSERLALSVVRIRIPDFQLLDFVQPTLFQMAVLRVREKEATAAGREYVVVALVVTKKPLQMETLRAVESVARDARLLGVELVLATDPHQLAELITETEQSPPTPPGQAQGVVFTKL